MATAQPVYKITIIIDCGEVGEKPTLTRNCDSSLRREARNPKIGVVYPVKEWNRFLKHFEHKNYAGVFLFFGEGDGSANNYPVADSAFLRKTIRLANQAVC